MTDLRDDDFKHADAPAAEDGERIDDDNGDELEHGEPDFPGQFPEEVVPHG